MGTKTYDYMIVVESPTKVQTLKRYLGPSVPVEASKGHVKDLPKSRLGVDLQKDFEPEYVTIEGKVQVLKRLVDAAANVKTVYLASDPDREGEAIAFHVAEELQKILPQDALKRVLFYELTQKGVQEGLKRPAALNLNLYNAHKARRVLDRLVGYKISPLLWKKVRYGLSAGRVQSVALRLVLERERAIRAFVPKTWFTLLAKLAHQGVPFDAELAVYAGKKALFEDEQTARGALKALQGVPLVVSDIAKSERKRAPKPPFKTSTLQQTAASVLGFSPKETMLLAQRLYEGVEIAGFGHAGLITYMRTDSLRLSPDMCHKAKEFVKDRFGGSFASKTLRRYENKARAQDAHEAIRPTDMALTPEALEGKLDRRLHRLYRLIFWRFVASQMTDARFETISVTLKAWTADGTEAIFRAKGETLLHSGFLAALEMSEPKESLEGTLPELQSDASLSPENLVLKEHTTKPPARFTEATLIKELEDLGIGRPSTYATIVSTVQERRYVQKENGQLLPTPLGITVSDLLVAHFPSLLDTGFTAKLENDLDAIEANQMKWQGLIADFYSSFAKELEKANEDMPSIKAMRQETGVSCPECQALTEVRFGKHGYFLSCSRYPECTFSKPCILEPDGSITIAENGEVQETGRFCPKCKSPMVIKKGRYGAFMACSNYPACKETSPVTLGIPCPKEGCDGELAERRSKRGSTFYGCTNYPKCTFVLSKEPVQACCTACGFQVMVRVKDRKGETKSLQCPNCKTFVELTTV
jgi:DNA topoisomerase-1